MFSYAHRFVGIESLPARLSEFDVLQSFQLTVADISAINERFRSELSAAIRAEFPDARIFYNCGHIHKQGPARFASSSRPSAKRRSSSASDCSWQAS